MPFREKSAWISLVTMLAVFGAYYGAILTGRLESAGMAALHYLLISIIAVVVLQVLLHVAAALLARADAGSPKDERERLIELKAIRIAYVVLIAGVLLGVFAITHLPVFTVPHMDMPQLGLTILAAVVVADVVKSAAKIAYYRLGV